MSTPNIAPGWYSDPSGQPGQRYHDGQRWTQHFTPAPPVVPTSATPLAVAVSNGGGSGGAHAVHAILTLLTCGLWLPIWLIFAIVDAFSNKSPTVAVGSAGGPAAASAGGPAAPFYGPPSPSYGPPAQTVQPSVSKGPNKVMASVAKTIVCVFFGLMLLGLIIEHPWLLAPAIPAAGVGAVVFWRYRMAQLKVLEEYRRDVVAHRAEDEDKLVNEGDPRGTYGRYPPASEEDSK